MFPGTHGVGGRDVQSTRHTVSTVIAKEVSVLIIPVQRSIMVEEKPQAELIRLRKEQNKARRDEVFGGLSPAELAEYDGKAERIHELENYFLTGAFAKKIL